MKFTLIPSLLIFGCFALFAMPLLAEDAESDSDGDGFFGSPSFVFEGALASNYIWRGQLRTDGPVFQPMFGVGLSGFTAYTWANYDLDNTNDASGEFSQADFGIEYERGLSPIPLTFTLGVRSYNYPALDVNGTAEVYGSVEWDFFINPKLSVYYDFAEIDGHYVSFELSKSIIGTPSLFNTVLDLSLDLDAGLGLGSSAYNKNYFGVDDENFNDLYGGASLTVGVLDSVECVIYARYMTLIDSSIRDVVAEDDNPTVGVKVRVEF